MTMSPARFRPLTVAHLLYVAILSNCIHTVDMHALVFAHTLAGQHAVRASHQECGTAHGRRVGGCEYNGLVAKVCGSDSAVLCAQNIQGDREELSKLIAIISNHSILNVICVFCCRYVEDRCNVDGDSQRPIEEQIIEVSSLLWLLNVIDASK
jgi:hypothetical protein